MDNQELKIKFEQVQAQIDETKLKGLDVTQYLKEKYNLLKEAYTKIAKETSSPDFDKNPKKYSTLLSYIKSMKETAKEAGMTTLEVDTFENNIKLEMKKNNLDWLLK